MQKAPFVFPIIGGRKIEHLVANLEALEISLSDEQIQRLESVLPFSPGFPSTFVVSTDLILMAQPLNSMCYREMGQNTCPILLQSLTLNPDRVCNQLGHRASRYFFAVHGQC